MCFFLSHSFVALVVCFGSLSCWNTHPQPIFNALAGFNALALVFSSSKHSQRAGFWAHLTTTVSPSTPLNHWHTSDRTVHVLSWAGDLVGAAGFHSFTAYCVPNCFLGDYGPSCLEIIEKILPCSSGLIPHRSHDHWNFTRWDLVWSPRPRETDSYFVFLPFVNYRTNCCPLLTKLLGDGLVAHSSLV